MKTTIAILLLSTGLAFAEPVSTNAIPSTNDVKMSAIKKVDPNAQTCSGRVVSKSGGNISIVVGTSQGVSGIGAVGYSLINQGNSKPKKALSQDSAMGRASAKKAEDAANTFTVIGYPNITGVMIGSTITFKGVKNDKAKVITWAE